MKDELIICPRCCGNLNYKIENNGIINQLCFSCGFTTNSLLHKDKLNEDFLQNSKLPELYKALVFYDEDGYVWQPVTINMPTKGMVFVDGDSILNWNWASVNAVPLDEKEKKSKRFPPDATHKMDMTTIKRFDQREFMDALVNINYFE
jgi:hypothetical protein